MKKTLSTDAKYKGLKLVDTVYGDDEARRARTQAQGLLTKYPNLKVIVAPTTVGILAAAQVVQQAKQVGQRQGHRPRLPERHEAVRQGRHLPGLRPVERPRPRLPRRAGRRPSWSAARSRAPRARPSRSRASTATSRTPSARTASSCSARPSGSTRPTSTSSTSRSPAASDGRGPEPRERSLPGLRPIRRSPMERVGFTMRLLPGPGGRVPPAARGRLAGDARRAAGRRARATTRSSSTATTCSPTSRWTTSPRSAAHGRERRSTPAGRRRWRR